MLKYSLPAVALALLGVSLADAQQHYGLNGPIVGHYRPAQPARLARADDSLSDLEALESLESLAAPANGSSAFDGPGLLSLDEPGQTALPPPRAESIPAPPAIAAPQTAAPAPHSYATPQSVLQPHQFDSPNSDLQAVPQRFDLNHAMALQDQNHRSAQYYSGHASHGSCGCSTGACHSCQGGDALMPYRKPILPQGYSFHGYFRADPCHYDIWSNYANEAAAACAHSRASLQPKPPKAACQGGQCIKGELVEPCRR